mgnify:CR=1 FL=1
MEPLVRVEGVSKFYPRVHRPGERLRAFAAVLAGKPAGEGAEVLHDVSLDTSIGLNRLTRIFDVFRGFYRTKIRHTFFFNSDVTVVAIH